MGFPTADDTPTNLTGELINGELYLKASDVVELLRARGRECASAAAEEEAKADDTGEAFLNAVAWRVAAEDYQRRADWLDVAVLDVLPTAPEPGS
jgi:hypothetical protein